MEIELNKQLPVIVMNFEEVKASLSQTIEKYKGIVVTEDGLQDCKATQKELAGMRVKIDNYRKEVKKEMSKPITEFEGKCKELIKLIEDAEQPIKNGITIFDNAKREEKKQVALDIISEIVKEHQLSEKYASQLSVLDKYMNLSTKPKDVKKDVEQRAFVLLQEQIKEQEMLEIIQDTIDNANKSINTPLKLEDFQSLLNINMPTSKIIQEINKRAELIREAEKPRTTEPTVINTDCEIEPIQKEEPVAAASNQNETVYSIELRVIGIKDEIAKLGKYLKDNNYNYAKIKAGVV
ncbi:DUF1351 domain-containing protein [Clostridium sp. CX1]|uniref:DUF1351 domain-containing protein n=1 Tax=Clostridium sp. CX1 TaxID=2978346 RepID=UPI0021C24FCD|nr:DUF1351 domain-containing protein [Clostridium sp. CX1]MCT8978282.1 DUF1351 domain-containing protein [Clostridium sp. CX1]